MEPYPVFLSYVRAAIWRNDVPALKAIGYFEAVEKDKQRRRKKRIARGGRKRNLR